jgi:hypothetical protein
MIFTVPFYIGKVPLHEIFAWFTWPIYTGLYCSSHSYLIILAAKHCTVFLLLRKRFIQAFHFIFEVNMTFELQLSSELEYISPISKSFTFYQRQFV